MRDYHGTPYASITDERTRRALSIVDYFLRDISRGMHRISIGERPDGSGSAIPIGEGGSLDDYLFLPGRAGGQTLHGVDSNPAFTITSGLSADLQRWQKDGVSPLNLSTVANGAATDYSLNTTTVGSGLQINMNGGASGIRLTSGTSPNLRGYVEGGTSAGSNLNLALTGFNGANGTSLWSGFSYQALVTMVDEDTISLNARVAVNDDPSEFASSAAGSQPDSFMVRRRASATSGVPTMLIAAAGAEDAQQAISIRQTGAGTAPSRTINATTNFAVRHDGRVLLGSRAKLYDPQVASSGGLRMLDFTDLIVFDVRARTATFADAVNTTALLLSNSTDSYRALIAGDAGNILNRLGICATSTVIGPRTSGALPAPVSSRILTVVDSSANVIADIDSSGTLTLTPPDDGPLYIHSSLNNSTFIEELIIFEDDGTNFIGTLRMPSAGLSADRVWTMPDGNGDVVLGAATQTLTNKTLQSSTEMRCNTISNGVSFVHTSDTSRVLRFLISGISTSTSRSAGWQDVSGSVVMVGDDPPSVASGFLGKVDLTAQTAAIGSTNLSSTPPAGIYAVEVYAATTTASGSGSPTLDVTIGWTDDIGATSANAAGLNGTTFPLDLATTTRAHARFVVQVASGDISYSTTINAASGSPQYSIYIRVVALG